MPKTGNLVEFLINHKINKDDIKTCTHTRIGNRELKIYGGAYHIPKEDEEQFYKLYYNRVFQDEHPEYLTEKQNSEGPICVDFDFRYNDNVNSESERPYTQEHITDIVDTYFDELKNLLILPNNEDIPVYIFEKEKMLEMTNPGGPDNGAGTINKQTKYKDGIHMIIGLHTDMTIQCLLREKILEKINDIWGDLPLTNNWKDVLDAGVTRGHTNWQLYGSQKPYNIPYNLTMILHANNDENGDINYERVSLSDFDLKNNLNKLSVRYDAYFNPEINSSIKPEYIEMKKQLMKQSKTGNSNKIISANYADNMVSIDPTVINNASDLDLALDQLFESFELSEYYIQEAHNYVMMLPEEYYGPGSYNKWIKVGIALKHTHPKMFLSWVKFSSQSSTFDFSSIGEMKEMWDRIQSKKNELTNRSIMYWCKISNSEKYNQIKMDTVDYFIEETLATSTEFDIASVLYALYKDKYICASIKNNLWYEYKNHKWQEIDSGGTLRLALSRDLHNIYSKKMLKFMSDVHELNVIGSEDTSGTIIQTTVGGTVGGKKGKKNDLFGGDDVQLKGNKYADVCMMLKRTMHKNNIMREAREIFYDNQFLEKLDKNPRLLGCANGVIDFNDKCFRPGRPEDYISKSTLINYYPLDTAKKSAEINEIEVFMEQLFPVQELRDYMWQHLSSCLIGLNENQTFHIYKGKGRNGKSKLIELMGLVLGEYKALVPVTLITEKRNGIGSTSSEIIQLKGVRLAVMQEPSKGARVNEGVLKEVTGCDPLQGRKLFHESETFIPMFKLVVCTNTLFEVGAEDDATWRRIRMVDYMSKFCETPVDNDPDEPYQYPVNKRIDVKFAEWKEVLLSMLVEKAYASQGNVEDCDIVMAASNKYRTGQDYFAAFIEDKIRVSNDGIIMKTELREEFKVWYNIEYGNNLPKGKELFEYFENRYGKYKKGWSGISIIYDNEVEMVESDEGER